ncbi:hypothetical protein SO802_000580 [Lithocarpus litseifolius]|uniref:Uncharacterized protein n=1 Tax=Lithocarpus litseifolius TaxID=425828 RepID=A0AAW2DSW8_9ROSI
MTLHLPQLADSPPTSNDPSPPLFEIDLWWYVMLEQAGGLHSVIRLLCWSRWVASDESSNSVIHKDQFELQGDFNLVTKTLNTKCGRLLSSNSNKLHQAYKKLVQSHSADYARSHPPKNATLEQWTELIDGRWTNEDWLKKSRKNSANGKKTSGKHRCGTKAFAVKVDEEENILKVQEDHGQDSNAIPLTQEEISNLVFKKKSSIVKGLGMRPFSSLVTTALSNSSMEYIQWL